MTPTAIGEMLRRDREEWAALGVYLRIASFGDTRPLELACVPAKVESRLELVAAET